jgi:ankyrin repeat protein
MATRHRMIIAGVAGCLLVASAGLARLRSHAGGQPRAQSEAAGLQGSSPVRLTNPFNPASPTPLMLASLNGEVEGVRTLLAGGADANEANADGTTALMCAAARGQVKALRLLLDAGGRADARNRAEQTALLLAAKYGQGQAAELLLAGGAQVNAERLRAVSADTLAEIYGEGSGRGGRAGSKLVGAAKINAFTEALINGHPAVAKLLLENGASPRVPGDGGADAALRLAARKGYAELVAPLVERGANVDGLDKNGRTPLMEAAARGLAGVAQALLKRGAAVNVKDGDGRTALLIAAAAGNRDVVEVLLKAGADKDAKDAFGKTAGEVARYNGHADVAARLGDTKAKTGKWPN